MRIVYIITRMDEFGGPQIHIRDFSMMLRQYGHDVHVIAGSEGQITDFLTANGVPCYIVPEMTRAISLSREPRAVMKVYKLLKQIRPDIVSCHSSKAGVVGRLAAWFAGLPVIFTVHGWAFTENVRPLPRRIYQVIEWIMGRFCNRLITVSEYDRQLGLAAHIAAPSKITTVHNGMPDYPRNRPANPGTACRLIMVARFAEQKDHKLLIDALSDIRDLDWTLDLAGNGDTTPVFEQVQRLGLMDKIRILGQRADIGDLLNASDLFLLITHWEGFPRSIVEAMRSGLPTIATAVAGIPESVVDGQTGLLVPHGDRRAVADAIAKLIADPALMAQMGQNARKRYDDFFTFQAMFNKTTAIYTELTGLPIYPRAVDKVDKTPAAA